jgi:hypothetical protein
VALMLACLKLNQSSRINDQRSRLRFSLAQLLGWFHAELHLNPCQTDILLAASSTKHLVKLISAYTGEEEAEIVTSPSFSRRLMFRQTILRTVSALLEKLLQELF